MLPRPDPIPSQTLRKLHRECIVGQREIRQLLNRAKEAGTPLSAGINRNSDAKTARIIRVGESALEISVNGFVYEAGRQLALNFDLLETHYFFAARAIDETDANVLIEFPVALYVTDKRESTRLTPSLSVRAPETVRIQSSSGRALTGSVVDWSTQGMAVRIRSESAAAISPRVAVEAVNGSSDSPRSFGEVRHREPDAERPGWVRLGLSVSAVQPGLPVEVESMDDAALVPRKGGAKMPPGEAWSRPIEFRNESGERLRGILDGWGDPIGATSVVIPPAWGRTKATLLPLSATIVESFRSAGKPIVVLRFDGTRRCGESYVPPHCDSPGLEHTEFVFSQAVADTQSAVRYVREVERTARVTLVTFSLAAVEGRRVVALDKGQNIANWVSVVGIADLQSALHVISGGVDYGYGLLRGLSFGRQELFGVLVDIDRAGRDSMEHGLTFLEDARRDMAEITVPVTWIHGRYDGWVDAARIRDLLACGDSSHRKLLEIPTGHQLRTSRRAFGVFGLIAREVGRARGLEITPVVPGRVAMRSMRHIEARPQPHGDKLAPFWRNYLLGRDDRAGMEILTATTAYREFMSRQIDLLGLSAGDRLADLGCGTSDFSLRLRGAPQTPAGLEVFAVDFVREALARGRTRLIATGGASPRTVSIAANLDWGDSRLHIPFETNSFNSVLASLLISYVTDPFGLLVEIRRILQPDGIAVISTLRRDADISKLYIDSIEDRYSDRPVEAFGSTGAAVVDASLPNFLNSAAQILDLEESGRFRFFEPTELLDLAKRAGFRRNEVVESLGSPPQALLLRGS